MGELYWVKPNLNWELVSFHGCSDFLLLPTLQMARSVTGPSSFIRASNAWWLHRLSEWQSVGRVRLLHMKNAEAVGTCRPIQTKAHRSAWVQCICWSHGSQSISLHHLRLSRCLIGPYSLIGPDEGPPLRNEEVIDTRLLHRHTR